MKAFLILFPLFAWGATQTVVDPLPARIKLHEILAEVHKNQASCLKLGETKTNCEKKMQNELAENGIPKDWFEKGEKEYEAFWAKKDKAAK